MLNPHCSTACAPRSQQGQASPALHTCICFSGMQVWLSTSSDLHCDALRDLRALGAHVNVINNCQTLDKETRVVGLAKDTREGVLFMYACLMLWPV